ncbi:MAG: hypothetical protein ACRCS8_00405 [Brevinema sp.]
MFKIYLLFFTLFLIPNLSFSVYEYPFKTTPYKLKEIRTENFRIIYSDESAHKAYEIAAISEDQYRNLAKIYGLSQAVFMPIRIVVSSDYQEANGFASTYLFPTIHLYVSMPPNLSDSHAYTEDEYLRSLLYHELTHIITLSYRHKFKGGGIWQIFSDTICPTVTFSARSFKEGAAIARESDSGRGRLNDPYLYHMMRRDLLDGKKLSFAEFGGAQTPYGSGSYPYTYGALFHNFISKNYSEYFDIDFWTKASIWGLSSENISRITKKNLAQLHEEFYQDLSNQILPYENHGDLILSKKKQRFNSVQQVDEYLYYYDLRSKTFYKYNLKTKKRSIVVYGNNEWESISVSPDHRSLFISGRRKIDKTALILDTKTMVIKSRPFVGLKQATFLPTSTPQKRIFTGIDLNYQYPQLVLYEGRDKTVLYEGNRLEYPDSPVSIDGTNIYFLHKYKNSTYLSFYNTITKSVKTITNPELKHIRFLTPAKDHISISYATDKNSFYKRAIIKGNKITFIENNIKGEIFDSVISENELIYRASFSQQDNFIKTPLAHLSTKTSTMMTTTLPKLEPSPIPIPENISKYKGSKDLGRVSIFVIAGFDAAGLRLKFIDSPAENIVTTALRFDFIKGTPQFYFSWTNQGLPVNINLTVNNCYVENNSIFDMGEHHLIAASVGFDYTGKSTLLAGSYSVFSSIALLTRLTGNYKDHPFEWNSLTSMQMVHTLGGSFNYLASEGDYGFYRQVALDMQFKKDYFDEDAIRAESRLSISPPYIPLLLQGFAIYDSTQISTDSRSVLGYSLMPPFFEYRNMEIGSCFAFMWTANIQVYAWEIQKGSGFGELFLERWIFDAGYRGGYWKQDLHSIYMRTTLQMSLFYGNGPFSTFFEINYPFQTGKLGFNFGLTISANL